MNHNQIIEFISDHFAHTLSEHPVQEGDDYEIDSDGSVAFLVDVRMDRTPPGGVLPFLISTAYGSFECSGHLTDLKNTSRVVHGDFICKNNGLTSLQGGPEQVVSYDCSQNNLTHLVGCPDNTGWLDCSQNKLQDLSTCPPAGVVYAYDNPIKTFSNLPSHIKQLGVTTTPTLPLLGLLNVPKVGIWEETTGEFLEDLATIFNKYGGQGKAAMLSCALELKQAGYAGNARW